MTSRLDRIVDDAVRRNAPPKPPRGFLGYQTGDGVYLLEDTTDPRYVHGRTEDGVYTRALITAGLTVDKDVAVIFRKRDGKTYADPDNRRDAETGVAAARNQAAQFGLVDSLRLTPGLVGFIDGQLTLSLEPLIYTNWRQELKQSLGSPLPIGDAIAALSGAETAWIIAGTDERTNDSAYVVSTPTEDQPDILQALEAASDLWLFQHQAAVLVVSGQAALAFTFDGWKDLRPWGQTATRRRDNLTATTDPTVNDDISAGYDVFSRWLNTTDGGVFECHGSTEGAAVWNEVSFV